MIKKFNKDRLRILKGGIKIYKIASYDIETDTSNNLNKFLFGGFIDSEGNYKCFKDKDKMIEYMCKHVDKDTWVFATKNSFDHYALFGHREDFLKEAPLMRGALLINAKYKNISTYDTKSFSKAGVKYLGLMLGLPKGSIDEEYMKKNFNKDIFKRRKMFRLSREYNKRDCEITREFMIGFQKVMNQLGGNLKITIGSCAMDLFKRKYLKEEIQHEYNKTFSDGMKLKEFLSKGYHGGRTEIFCRSTKNVISSPTKEYNYYDFNSLYPAVMLNEYPRPSSCHLTSDRRGKLNISSVLNFEGISDVEVLHPLIDYGVLPLVVNNKLCFPVGKYRDVFTHLELRKLLSVGGSILKCYKTACYTKTFSPFKDWVNDLYALRLKYHYENNLIYKEIVKLLLNNLYGKFFQRHIMNMEFISLKDRNDNDLKQDGFTFDYNVGFGYRETPKESNQAFIIPVFAVYTTAYARLKLYDKLIELEGVYCDTDSILTTKEITPSTKLGELKFEDRGREFMPIKPKTYSFRSVITGKLITKFKGLNLGRTEEERQKNFMSAIDGKPIKQINFTTIKSAIRSGGKKLPNEIIESFKTSKNSDDKRVWLSEYDDNGLEISKPFIIGFENEWAYNQYCKKLKTI